MVQVIVGENHQITLPLSIVSAADIHENDRLAVTYSNGVITLQTTSAPSKQRESLMSFAGISHGLYGKTTADVHAYILQERDTWTR